MTKAKQQYHPAPGRIGYVGEAPLRNVNNNSLSLKKILDIFVTKCNKSLTIIS